MRHCINEAFDIGTYDSGRQKKKVRILALWRESLLFFLENIQKLLVAKFDKEVC